MKVKERFTHPHALDTCIPSHTHPGAHAFLLSSSLSPSSKLFHSNTVYAENFFKILGFA